MQHKDKIKDKKIVIYDTSNYVENTEDISERFEINIRYNENGKEHSVSIRDKSSSDKTDLGLIIYHDGCAKKIRKGAEGGEIFECNNQKSGWLNGNGKTEEYEKCFNDIIELVQEYEEIKKKYDLKSVEEYLKIKKKYDQNMVNMYKECKERLQIEIKAKIKKQYGLIYLGVDKNAQEQNALALINEQGLTKKEQVDNFFKNIYGMGAQELVEKFTDDLAQASNNHFKADMEKKYGLEFLQWYEKIKEEATANVIKEIDKELDQELKRHLDGEQNKISQFREWLKEQFKKKPGAIYKLDVLSQAFLTNLEKSIEETIKKQIQKALKKHFDPQMVKDYEWTQEKCDLQNVGLSDKQKEFFEVTERVREQCKQVCENVMDIHYGKTPKNISDVKEPYRLSQRDKSIAIIPMKNGVELKDQAITLYADGWAKLGFDNTGQNCSPTEMYGWLGQKEDYKNLYGTLKELYENKSADKDFDGMKEIYNKAMMIYFNSLSDKDFESLCQQKEQPYSFLNNMLREYKKELKKAYLNNRTNDRFVERERKIKKKVYLNNKTNEKLAERYRKVKIKLLRDKYDQLSITNEKDHYIVEKKDSKKPQDTKKFYFYSFQRTIEDFNKKGYTGELGKVAKTDNKDKCKSISTLCVDHRDNLMTSHFLQDKAPFAVGCNFLVANDILRNHDSMAYCSDGIATEANKELFTLSRLYLGQPWYGADHCAVAGAAKDVSPVEAILTNRYYKQSHKIKTKFDELLLQAKNNTYSIHDFCLYFDFSYEGGWELKSHINKTSETILSQIEKVVAVNKKKGITKINIIDYGNAPSFVTIPNDLKCIKEYVGHRKTGKNFGSQQIKDMNKKYEQAHKNELAKKKDENIPSSLKPIKKKNNNNKIIIDAKPKPKVVDTKPESKQINKENNKENNNKQPIEPKKEQGKNEGKPQDVKKEQTTEKETKPKPEQINKNNLGQQTNNNKIIIDDSKTKDVNKKQITKLKPINKKNLGQHANNNLILESLLKQINQNNIDQSKKNNNAGKYVNNKKTLKPIKITTLKLKLKPKPEQTNQLNNIGQSKYYNIKHNGTKIISGLHNKKITHKINVNTTKLGKGGQKIQK